MKCKIFLILSLATYLNAAPNVEKTSIESKEETSDQEEIVAEAKGKIDLSSGRGLVRTDFTGSAEPTNF